MFSYRPLFRFGHKRRFDDLSEREVLALAISSEEEDGAIYSAYAEKLRPDFAASAAVFEAMAAEEDGHRRMLIDLYRKRFGDFIVPIRREHVADFIVRSPVWLVENLGIDRVRQEAADMEREAREFYLRAASRATDAATRKLLGDLTSAGVDCDEARIREALEHKFVEARRQFIESEN